LDGRHSNDDSAGSGARASRMSRRFRRRVRALAALGAAGVLLAPTAALANTFGPTGCCAWADNSNHTYFNNQLTLGNAAAMNYAMNTRLASTDMSVDEFQSWNNDTDVVAYDTDYNEPWWGNYVCEVLVSGSSTKCNRATLRFDLTNGTATTAVTCHEVGHSVGLGHSTASGSCMREVFDTVNDYDSHDRSHINGYY